MLFDIFQGRVFREPGACGPIPKTPSVRCSPVLRLRRHSASHPCIVNPVPRLNALRVLYQRLCHATLTIRRARLCGLVKKNAPAHQTTGATRARRCARRARFRQSSRVVRRRFPQVAARKQGDSAPMPSTACWTADSPIFRPIDGRGNLVPGHRRPSTSPERKRGEGGGYSPTHLFHRSRFLS